MGNQEFVSIWVFEVEPWAEAEFRSHYAADGAWVQLFRVDPDFLGTELLVDQAAPGRYLTVDRWRSRAAWERFRRERADAYAALDRGCERLTIGETLIGMYEAAASENSEPKASA